MGFVVQKRVIICVSKNQLRLASPLCGSVQGTPNSGKGDTSARCLRAAVVSRQNFSNSFGENHKVRSRYESIIWPIEHLTALPQGHLASSPHRAAQPAASITSSTTLRNSLWVILMLNAPQKR